MNIPLNEFEHIIDETILKRGLSYFKNSIDFYRKIGFEKVGNTQPMWIYKGNEH